MLDIIITCEHLLMNADRRGAYELRVRCAIGSAGIVANKIEGDGATPRGSFALRRVLYRADRLARPVTRLPLIAINADDGWCDAPDDPRYNQPVTLPYPASAEQMMRDDHLYDICVIVGHNDDPPVSGLGSAIFFHLAHDDYRPTQGCVAVALCDMLTVLERVTAQTRLVIGL